VFIVLSPLIGLLLALTLTVRCRGHSGAHCRARVDRTFRVLQFFSRPLFARHGTNDAQKTMGIIVGLLVAEQALFVNFPGACVPYHRSGYDPARIIIRGAADGLGTVSGGWDRQNDGQRLTKLTPFVILRQTSVRSRSRGVALRIP